MRRLALLLPLLLSVHAGCAPADDDLLFEEDEVVDGKADGYASLAYRTVTTKTKFAGLSTAEGILIQGRSMKFVIDRRNPASQQLYFMNANYKKNGKTPDSAKYHYYFSQATLPNFDETIGSFNDQTYWTQDKTYVAGSIQSYTLGASAEPIYAIQLYPQDVGKEATILDIMKTVKKGFRIPNQKLAFVSSGPQQTTATVKDALGALGVQTLTIEQILGSVKYIPMNLGECWGILRIFPADNDALSPMDLPVFDELPLDLSVVAGVITKSYQDANSHVNLKSKERDTPNMVLRDASLTHAQLKQWANKPIHLIVKADGFKIEATTEAVIKQKIADRNKAPWQPIAWTSDTRLLSYQAMCPNSPSACATLSRAYGTKAANLGMLTNKAFLGRTTDASSVSKTLGYDLVPKGFGVPVQAYHDFVAAPENAELKQKLTALIAGEKAGTLSTAERVAQLKVVQQLFYAGTVPAQTLAAIQAKLEAELPGVKKIKVRSSGNAEDLENFDGAGLHDSFAANLTKVDNAENTCLIVEGEDGPTDLEVDPKTLSCAMKAVYASLWNKRAIEERSFARLDHAMAGMGLSIVPKYDLESEIVANSVLVSRVIGTGNVSGYSFSNQVGNTVVTNPAPGTYSENMVVAFAEADVPPSFIITRYATPVAGQPALTAPVYTDAQTAALMKIVQQVETAYCRVKPTYYPGGNCTFVGVDPDKPKSLDFETKLLENGHMVIKQFREFGGK